MYMLCFELSNIKTKQLCLVNSVFHYFHDFVRYIMITRINKGRGGGGEESPKFLMDVTCEALCYELVSGSLNI